MQLQAILEQEGCEVVGPFATAREALQRLACEAVDAALLDFTLREGDSTAIAEELARRDCPIIFVTGHQAEAVLPSLDTEVWTLGKPLDEQRLRTLVSALSAAKAR